MGSQYPTLDNRPIDQWKVTELREELRRRKLTTKGLKEDLVKRLDEAIRSETELLEEKELNNMVDPEPEPQEEHEEKDSSPTEELNSVADPEPEPQDGHEEKESSPTEELNSVVDPEPEPQEEHEEKDPSPSEDLNIMVDPEPEPQEEHEEKDPSPGEELNSMVDPEPKTQEEHEEKDPSPSEELNSIVDPEPEPQEEHEEKDPSSSEELNSMVDPEPEPQEEHEEKDPSPSEMSEIKENANVAVAGDERKTFENEVMVVDADDGTRDEGQGTEVLIESMGNAVSDGAVEEQVTPEAMTEENISHEELTSWKSDANGEDFMDDMENREPKPPTEDTTSNPSEPGKQVSEVSLDLGFQVKCESISTDSVTNNEKIELKDNLNANNFHLELAVGKPEMVQPSSTDVAPVAGEFNSLDNDQEPEDNQGSVEEIDDVTNTTSLDLSNKLDNSNGGSPEKLNLDRSSGDESMEEDVLETKQSEPSNNCDEVGDIKDIRELHVVKEGPPADAVVGGLSPDKKDIIAEEDKPVVPSEKRKLEDQGSTGTTEPVKRQRRWNAEIIKVPEPQTSNQTSSTTPKETFQSTPRRIFTRTDSGLSVESPKERFVPPLQKTATTSLRIDRFLRPFTLKAVQELLAKTGTVCSFWMDHIKTHCYVTYSSVEEAVSTRNALYNLQWPPNGGRLLAADFVDPEEVKAHVEAPQSPAAAAPSAAPQPSAPLPERPNAAQAQPPPQSNRPQLPPPPPLSQPPPASHPPPAKEREGLPLLPPPPPPPSKKPEPSILTLDDLFKKTRAIPRIYYLPLSEEQVAAKLSTQGRGTRA